VLAATDRARTIGRLQVLATAVLFSTGGAVIKATSLDGLATASLRSAFAAMALGLYLAMFRPRTSFEASAHRRATDRFDAGTFGVALSYAATMTLFVVATKLTTAANAIFIQSGAPLFVAPIAYVVLGERIRRRDLKLMPLLAVGIALFFAGGREPLQTAPAPWLGNLVAVACALAWAVTLVGLRLLETTGRDVGRLILLPGNVMVAVVAGVLASWQWPIAGWDWLMLGYLGVMQIAVAYVLLTRGVRKIPAVEASLLLLLEPVLSAVWAWLVHGEALTVLAMSGGVLVLGATMARAGAREAE
jgi:DME family drug/metabolite transporter